MKTKHSRANGYGQYCPLALATELLCRRWTILVVSRLVDGCKRFSDIHRGVPKISPSLLSTRLSELEHAGIVQRRKVAGRRHCRYEITEAGRELGPIIDMMAIWGQHWARDMEVDDLDPAFLAWSMHLRMDATALPPGRTVIEFRFSGTPADLRRFWILSNDGEIDMCLKDPGYETDLLVRADLRRFTEAWRGFRDLRNEIRQSRIKLSGPPRLVRAFPDWLQLSALAPYERRRSGREARLAANRDNGRFPTHST